MIYLQPCQLNLTEKNAVAKKEWMFLHPAEETKDKDKVGAFFAHLNELGLQGWTRSDPIPTWPHLVVLEREIPIEYETAFMMNDDAGDLDNCITRMEEQGWELVRWYTPSFAAAFRREKKTPDPVPPQEIPDDNSKEKT